MKSSYQDTGFRCIHRRSAISYEHLWTYLKSTVCGVVKLRNGSGIHADHFIRRGKFMCNFRSPRARSCTEIQNRSRTPYLFDMISIHKQLERIMLQVDWTFSPFPTRQNTPHWVILRCIGKITSFRGPECQRRQRRCREHRKIRLKNIQIQLWKNKILHTVRIQNARTLKSNNEQCPHPSLINTVAFPLPIEAIKFKRTSSQGCRGGSRPEASLSTPWKHLRFAAACPPVFLSRVYV